MGSERHLKTGDPQPEFAADKLQLLSMRFCPFAQRIHLVLDRKQIPYTIYRINLHSKPEWLTKFSKLGKVPAICLTNEPNKPWLIDSMIVADYLDEKYTDQKLHASDPIAKANDRILIQQFESGILGNFLKVAIHGLDTAPNALKDIADSLDNYEEELTKRGTLYFGGEKQPGMMDYMIWPFFERVVSLKEVVPGQFDINQERYPNLKLLSESLKRKKNELCGYEERANGTGDPIPNFSKDGKLQLLSMRFCPYAQRIVLVLDAKKIPYNTFNINLHEKPEWLTKFSPTSKVPALGVPKNNSTNELSWIIESLIAADYLDEQYPERQLNAHDNLAKAIDRMWIKRFDDVIMPHFYRVALKGLEHAPGSLTEIADGLDSFEQELNRRHTIFYGGSQPGMFDYMIWPFCERIDALKFIVPDKYEMNKERYPKLIQWLENMMDDEAVKKSYLTGDIHAKYAYSRKMGSPDYDMLLTNPAKKQRLN